MYDPHNTESIPIGTPVIAFNGDELGRVREVFPHYILVHHAGEHTDMEVPVHAIQGLEDGKLRVSVNRWAVSDVDDEESYHRQGEES